MRATNNIQNVLVVRANYLSVYHIAECGYNRCNTESSACNYCMVG
ncbi:hypothetical protein [Candidatus Minimicrobia naudis]